MASEFDSRTWQATAYRQGGSVTRRREAGVFAVMFVPLLLVILALCGLALDAGQVYNRKVDLTGTAKAVALAAARELNGTDAGITSAKAKAKATAEALHYRYFENGVPFTWSESLSASVPVPHVAEIGFQQRPPTVCRSPRNPHFSSRKLILPGSMPRRERSIPSSCISSPVPPAHYR
jgi:hypothetical protein